MSTFLGILIVSFIVLWLIGFITQIVVRSQLRSLYPDVASRIAPGMMQKSMTTDLAYLRFVIRREYRSLNSRSFVRLCDFFFAVIIVSILVGIILACVMIHERPHHT